MNPPPSVQAQIAAGPQRYVTDWVWTNIGERTLVALSPVSLLLSALSAVCCVCLMLALVCAVTPPEAWAESARKEQLALQSAQQVVLSQIDEIRARINELEQQPAA